MCTLHLHQLVCKRRPGTGRGCPPSSWSPRPTVLGEGVSSAALNPGWGPLAFGPSPRPLAGLRTHLLSLGRVWEVRPSPTPRLPLCWPSGLTSVPQKQKLSGWATGGWREAHPPPPPPPVVERASSLLCSAKIWGGGGGCVGFDFGSRLEGAVCPCPAPLPAPASAFQLAPSLPPALSSSEETEPPDRQSLAQGLLGDSGSGWRTSVDHTEVEWLR